MSPKAFPLVEPLESRIAPASVINTGVVGNPAPPANVSYTDAPFHAENPATINYDAGDALGANFVGGTHSYYIKLSTGDRLLNFKSGVTELIKVKSGNVVAFFSDKNGDGEVDLNELTGLSLGKGANVSIGGNVDGDIVANFNDATGKIDATGAGLTTKLQTIKQISVDNVTRTNGVLDSGAIISAGAMTNVVGKTVNRILAGSGANGYAYDFNGDETGGHLGDAGGGAVLAYVTLAKQAGSSITGVSVTAATLVQAGGGGTSAAGGAITKLTLDSDTNGVTIQGGAGGAGAAGSLNGGAGGALNTILVRGLDSTGSGDTSVNSLISIIAGGGGAASAGGKGGAGGAVQKTFVGYDTANANTLSAVALRDNVLVQAGSGAGGKVAGAGGALTDIHVRTNTPHGGATPELRLLAGDGGQNTGGAGAGGKDGIGGSITNVEARNGLEAGDDSVVTSSVNAQILVQAGAGGLGVNTDGFGALGGSITTAKVLGFQVDFEAGDGSIGDQGAGGGGSLKTITIEGANNNDIHVKNLTLNAGQGQSSTTGKAGTGGLINGITANSTDLESLVVNSGTNANGGNAGKGKGGTGGAVTALRVEDTSFSTVMHPNGHEGMFTLRAGNAGNGPTGGGAGGAVSNVILTPSGSATVADNITIPTFVSGSGGNATTSGKGGAAGNISNVALFIGGQVAAVDVIASVTSGVGGNGMLNGAGGVGGTLQTVNVLTGGVNIFNPTLHGGAVTETANVGGSGGATGAAGAGGAIKGSHGTSADASVALTAGNAGAAGVKAGAGGAIIGSGARALKNISVQAGNGNGGGAGGNLTNVVFTDPSVAAPTGNISLISGNGSAAGNVAGAGGTISGLSGYVSTGAGTTTKIKAGNGASVPTKASAGGSVQDVRIFDGGGTGTIFMIDAGNAVAAASASKGGAGGNAKDIFVFALDPATNFLHVSAGDGGSTSLANGTGGLGGTVTNVRANHDIGNISDGVTASGKPFGYDPVGATTMGGIFAGSGGLNTGNPLKNGAAGNVTAIAAEAIASIVAGHPANGAVITKQNLITKVDDITLIAKDLVAGVQLAQVDGNGNYTNYVTANLVGAVVNPAQGGAVAYPAPHNHGNTFDLAGQNGSAVSEYVDTVADSTFGIGDATNANTAGFIAALQLTAKKNFVPEALLTLDGSGNSQFIDYTNGKANP